MSRHLADHQKVEGGRAQKAFFDLARRESGPHPSLKTLFQKPRSTKPGGRVEAFLRVKRETGAQD